MQKKKIMLLLLPVIMFSCSQDEVTNPPTSGTSDPTSIVYKMPEESAPHEGTWLQWPHKYQYGITYRNRLDPTWVAMTKELAQSEKVHIIAYDGTEKDRIVGLLTNAGVSLSNIDFKLYPTDDFWVRDNGPIYVKDKNGKLFIQDWGFNGWGNKAQYSNCNTIPAKIANDSGIPKIDLNSIMINEGGSVEIDGNGVLMACKSSILNENRNPGMTQQQAEAIFTKNLGITKFIWLDGKANLDITDMHIDGFARFANPTTIITMNADDLEYWQVPNSDMSKLYNATQKNGTAYQFVKVPLTKYDVTTTYGKNVGRASYINYYIANNRVLVPNYNDPNDTIANRIIQQLYPDKKVIGIDCRNLFANGGMVHCVTQQQPK
ncbi:Agmatine deiminase [Chryseobacterium nakagawai]|uniref:Agmatine deiminase family protein n=1 Tax=Chryseobacterium nakagawai TaxID=1241982 RepID=A0AAD1DT48_CHRNA|nr:agmatine deiminase family protein [Chryseobacterium nakagawai]AZA93471.1 agmatine deiminase family protein [Chryseobacterium nakagawai]VEH20155.1 Agmatine deiminase [Chryseobacterium nakagawai]